MRSPRLADLPRPLASKSGWPWTVESTQLPDKMPDGSSWPKISVVTPSYNQGQFVEETIRSVLLQGYPDLEYIVIDGGSTDESVDIIGKYERWLTYWISEADSGAPHALNKGLMRATGWISAWLNSDDVYLPGVLGSVAAAFRAHPDADVISGVSRIFSRTGSYVYIGPSPLRTFEDFCTPFANWTKDKLILQPEAFFKTGLYAMSGPIREDLSYCYDVMFWISAAARGALFESVSEHWADFRSHPAQKTADVNRSHQELARAVFSFCQSKSDMDRDQFIRICADVISLLEQVSNNERRRARSFKESTSYKIGRALTKLRFW
jgi:glycosyltransferase involved in cell wall biosynthesis